MISCPKYNDCLIELIRRVPVYKGHPSHQRTRGTCLAMFTDLLQVLCMHLNNYIRIDFYFNFILLMLIIKYCNMSTNSLAIKAECYLYTSIVRVLDCKGYRIRGRWKFLYIYILLSIFTQLFLYMFKKMASYTLLCAGVGLSSKLVNKKVGNWSKGHANVH